MMRAVSILGVQAGAEALEDGIAPGARVVASGSGNGDAMLRSAR